MFIQLNEDRAIRADGSTGYALCKKSFDKNGDVLWKSYKYGTGFEHMISMVPEQMLKESDVQSIREAITLLRNWTTFLKEELTV